MKIREYSQSDKESVIALWRECHLITTLNDPEHDIDQKLLVNPDLFLVGQVKGDIVATVMGGYEGHRGWINYLAVSPAMQRRGYGKLIMAAVEKRITGKGCPKINLQIRATNTEVLNFYKAIGYLDDNVIGLGKRFIRE